MSQQPKTETDRLANVIQVLQMGQKTGRLLVERNEGQQFEQGIIAFVNGQVVQASINQQQGPEIFNWLKGWGPCRFTFTTEQRSNTTGPMPTLSRQAQPQTSTWGGWTPTHTSSLPTTSPGPSYPQQNGYSQAASNTAGARPRTPTAWLAAIPYRTRPIDEGMHLIEQMGLSRTHRRIFLLIDGGRAVKDLVRLMAYEPEVVLRLLQDLERAGVIQM